MLLGIYVSALEGKRAKLYGQDELILVQKSIDFIRFFCLYFKIYTTYIYIYTILYIAYIKKIKGRKIYLTIKKMVL